MKVAIQTVNYPAIFDIHCVKYIKHLAALVMVVADNLLLIHCLLASTF